jgi:hypothetical protein
MLHLLFMIAVIVIALALLPAALIVGFWLIIILACIALVIALVAFIWISLSGQVAPSPVAPSPPAQVFLLEPPLACFGRDKVKVSCDTTHHMSGETFATSPELPLNLWTKEGTHGSLRDCQDRLDAYKSPEYLLKTDVDKGSFNWAFNQMSLQSICVEESDPRLID